MKSGGSQAKRGEKMKEDEGYHAFFSIERGQRVSHRENDQIKFKYQEPTAAFHSKFKKQNERKSTMYH